MGKSVLLTLAFASCYVWAVIFSKAMLLMRLRRVSNEFKEYVYNMPKLKRLIVEDASIYFQVYDEFINHYSTGYAEEKKHEKLDRIVEEIAQAWEAKLSTKLDYLSIIGSIAPFVGLFGTVWGIMNGLQSIASASSASIVVVAPSISEALFATAVGLFVAIPATIASHLFYAKIEEIVKDAKLFSIYIGKKLDGKGL